MAKKPTPPAKRKRTGRPSAYSPELGTEICLRLCEGESLRAICADQAMPNRRTVTRWLFDVLPEGDPRLEFRPQYVRARDVQAELFADDIIEIADGASEEEIGSARLKIDARKWVVTRLVPRYAKKIVHEGGEKPVGVAVELDVREAARRIAHIFYKADPKKKD